MEDGGTVENGGCCGRRLLLWKTVSVVEDGGCCEKP